jgi:hypothetical protein
MPVTLARPDGLHLTTKATLAEILQDELIREFAGGLLGRAVAGLALGDLSRLSLAKALHQVGSAPVDALLTALLVLDAEVNAVVEEETRVFPLPGFLSYRDRLPLATFPLNLLRLPPLNPGGHYHFAVLGDHHYLAVRLDLHAQTKAAGHVRIALASLFNSPQRIKPVEERLDRHFLTGAHIDRAITAGADLLTDLEQAGLREILLGLIENS